MLVRRIGSGRSAALSRLDSVRTALIAIVIANRRTAIERLGRST
jgi:hypothetical protein